MSFPFGTRIIDVPTPEPLYEESMRRIVEWMGKQTVVISDHHTQDELFDLAPAKKEPSSDLPDWSMDDLRMLINFMPAHNSVGYALMDTTARSPGTWISFPEICKSVGLSPFQGRAHIGAFTKVCNKVRKGQWPIGAKWGEFGQRYYCISKDSAARWQALRAI